MSKTTQDNRRLVVSTDLGKDVLLIDSLDVREGTSDLFSMRLNLLADLDEAERVKPKDLIGSAMSVEVNASEEAGPRYFHGMVVGFGGAAQDARFASFHADLVPWLWLLTQQTNCRVFQDETIPGVLQAVFSEWQGKFSNLVKFEIKTSATYRKVDYCVQYRESDFNFVCRLMEQAGMFYFFDHSQQGHTLVVGDDVAHYPKCPGKSTWRFAPESGVGLEEDVVATADMRTSLVPGKLAMRDHHHQMTQKSLEVSEFTPNAFGGNDKLELFDYPGDYAQMFNAPDQRLADVESQGRDFALVRLQEQECRSRIVTLQSTCPSAVAGNTFEMEGKDGAKYKLPETDGEYLITRVQHFCNQSPDYVSGLRSGSSYRNQIVAIPKETPLRPSRSTPKPIVEGLQTAEVVGPAGEEIHVDKYGRIRVEFYWNRNGPKNDKSTCWIRVGQSMAGPQWGTHFWPRIGQEVLVAFVEGDPDRPVVTGTLYNDVNMPPYKLPDNKTRSGVKSRSTMDGSSDNFNELRFEDKKDEEEIYLHAEKDFNCVVENNETRKVGFDKKDAGDQTIEIYNDQTIEVGVGSKGGSQKSTIQKDRSNTLKQGNDNLTIEMGNRDMTLKLGNETNKISLGKSSTTAMQSIELKVGQSSIKIDQTGVEIKGMMVKLNGQIMTEVKGGAMTSVEASGIMKVKGGIMMLG